MLPQTTTEPPPNRSCSATQQFLNRSFFELHTRLRQSWKSKQNLDSSVKSTDRIRRLANWRRQLRWRAVNGGRTAGFLACKPDAWSQFLTICVEIRTPDAARNSLFNVTADDIRFRFASKAVWRSWWAVVRLDRPLCGLRCTLIMRKVLCNIQKYYNYYLLFICD